MYGCSRRGCCVLEEVCDAAGGGAWCCRRCWVLQEEVHGAAGGGAWCCRRRCMVLQEELCSWLHVTAVCGAGANVTRAMSWTPCDITSREKNSSYPV
ncbi:hypothetical protein COCON_G00071920 [Conger conger]|uniref:Uncharacterized protein n=1 Tax=Conger conger TaxID=82655 RepID=A0A9Q1DMV0_CONCO|nr:hypothetical protein COCON_G00071920 [Conger conger]